MARTVLARSAGFLYIKLPLHASKDIALGWLRNAILRLAAHVASHPVPLARKAHVEEAPANDVTVVVGRA